MGLLGRLVGVALGLVLVAGTAACSAPEAAAPPAAAAVAYNGPANGSSLKSADFAEAIKLPGTVILDVRTPEEFNAGHLEGAINIDIRAADWAANLDRLDKSATYAVYCHSGNRSNTALQQMKGSGFQHAYQMAGGILSWTMGGRKLVTG